MRSGRLAGKAGCEAHCVNVTVISGYLAVSAIGLTESIFDDLAARGCAALKEMIEQKREENLYLEFKTLGNQNSANLTKDDRRLLAKSLCGFCNAEGGLLILGVETSKVDGIDVASSLKKLENLSALRNRIVSALPEFLSPQNPKMSVLSIPESTDSSAGYVAIHVPATDSRPHMSIVHHQYFRRGSDGTRVLEHAEIKELILLPQQGKLSLKTRMRSGMSSGTNFAFDLVLSLRNEGRVSVRAPFIRASGASLSSARPTDAAFALRRSAHGMGVYADAGTLAHVDDEIEIATIATGLQLRGASGYDHKYFIKQIIDGKSVSQFSVRPYFEAQNNPHGPDKLIKGEISFGGENVPTQTTQLAIDKWNAFEMMAATLLQ
jgi:hypothetical protein